MIFVSSMNYGRNFTVLVASTWHPLEPSSLLRVSFRLRIRRSITPTQLYKPFPVTRGYSQEYKFHPPLHDLVGESQMAPAPSNLLGFLSSPTPMIPPPLVSSGERQRRLGLRTGSNRALLPMSPYHRGPCTSLVLAALRGLRSLPRKTSPYAAKPLW
ncbi:hypothetical protein B0H14DRAFT_2826189 [Mycena olivaceomarginata]|nr:hypothetical protein B0H14DRAFT_2826189 [Mycena olivaceomarginata]